ncbi:MFS transporter [Candidatus Micrarchaeota archaeon]|nr:MFS transporter [Candidatus Micrarchaeota archaeon]
MTKDQTADGGGLQKLLAIHMLYTFIVSALGVLVPLYLLDQHVDIAMVGVILSLGPLTFTVFRLLFASISDDVGTRVISIFYSMANLLAIEFYTLFISPMGFVAAILSEGLRTSGFWAIARTDVLAGNHLKEPGRELARFSNMRQLADGLGRLAIGFLLVYFAFSGSLSILLVLSLSLIVLIISSSDKVHVGFRVGQSTLKHIFKPRSTSFWKAALLQLLVWLPYNMLQAFLIPVYLISELKLGYSDVGMVLAMLSLATAGISILLMKLGIPNRLLLLLTLLSVPALVFLPFLGADGLILLALMAVSFGCSNIVGEYILVDVVFRSKEVSADIGVLYVPLKIAEVLFLSLGGLAIAHFGYVPLFLTLAASIGLFVILGHAVLSPSSSGAAAIPDGHAKAPGAGMYGINARPRRSKSI